MLNPIVHFAIRHRGALIALAVMVLGYNLYRLSQAKYDVFPQFTAPQVEIQTEAPGLAPEQVEALVTQPLENEINGVAGIASLYSNSIQGVSVITINFQPNTDIFQDRQAIAERLAALSGKLPQGAEAPVIVPLTSATGDLMVIGITSDSRTLMDLRTLADWVITPRLLAVPGVAKVGTFGGDVKQLQIQVDPERLTRYGFSIDELASAARLATGVRGAGFIDSGNKRIVLQTEGQSLTADALARTVLTHTIPGIGPVTFRLSDVAIVREAPAPPFGSATIQGHPGVVLNLWAQYGANTLDTTQGVDQAFADLKPILEAEHVQFYDRLFRAASYVDLATHNIRSSLLIGAVLVVVVLCLFLFNVRTAAISCTAIPLSLLTAVSILQALGYSLNMMTLGGLAIATGEVVDDAVIDVENILRRLKENRSRSDPRPASQVVLEASLEVRSAVIFAAAAVVLVFLPILTMAGVAGRLFAPLGLAYIFSIITSLIVALTLTPALCRTVLAGKHLPSEEPPVVRALKARYRNLLGHVERHPKKVIGSAVVFTVLGLCVVPFLGGEFLPELHEGHFIVHMTAPPGTSLEGSLQFGAVITQALLKIPTVKTVAQRAGRAAADDTYGTHESEFEVDLKPLTAQEAEGAAEAVRAALTSFPGVSYEVNTFLQERIEETLSGFTASVVVNVFGSDLNSLDQAAQQIAASLKKVPGAADVQIQSPPGIPQMSIRLRPDALAHWGFSPIEVLEAVQTAYGGDVVSQVYQGNRVFAVSVILDPSRRQDPNAVGVLPLHSPTGTYVHLRDLTEITLSAGRFAIHHQHAQRCDTVTCNVTGRDTASFLAEVRQRIQNEVRVPTGSYIEFAGTAEAQAQSQRDLLVRSLAAGAGIVLLLSLVMGHWRNLLLVLLNLPFALVGGVLAVWITRESISIGALVGFVTLFGITLRNSIMMISHFEHLVDQEGMGWGPEAAVRGASERLAPILMTALVTSLGLLPLALGRAAPGREIEGPMAVVILGGLVTSTALNLLVLPTLALRFGYFAKKTEE